jgi:hypothetical protein
VPCWSCTALRFDVVDSGMTSWLLVTTQLMNCACREFPLGLWSGQPSCSTVGNGWLVCCRCIVYMCNSSFLSFVSVSLCGFRLFLSALVVK